MKGIRCKICGKVRYDTNTPICASCDPTNRKPFADYRKTSARWISNKDREFIRTNYAKRGAQWCANEIGRSTQSIHMAANRMGLMVSKDAMDAILYSGAKRRMESIDNPMKNESTRKKVADFWVKNADLSDQILAKARQACSKVNPTKLEIKLFEILDQLGVAYEKYPIVKTKFTVDCRIGMTIIQADGDYWHGHPRFEPLTDRQSAQQKRDKAQDKYLTACGYTVIRIWECEMSVDHVKQVLHL